MTTEDSRQTPEPERQAEATPVAEASFGPLSRAEAAEGAGEQERRRNLEALYNVPLTITARLGETEMSIKDLLNLDAGAVVELDRLAGEPIDLYVNGILVGSGNAVVVNDNFGIRITELLSPAERIANL